MNTQGIPENIAETLLEQASKEAESRVETEQAHDGTDVAVLVARQTVTATPIQGALDAFAAVPRSRAGKLRALDLGSFAGLVLRDYDHGSVVLVDVSGAGASFEAVLDYHHTMRAALEPTARTGQRHGRETIVYAPELSDEWEAWTEQAGKPMTQGAFAEWIDEHLPDIADPGHLANDPDSTAAKFGQVYGFSADQAYGYATPERLQALSTGFQVREGSVIKSAVNLASGEVQLQYETSHTDEGGKPLNVPRRFLLSIPVFKREAAYLVPVKLSYRRKAGAIEWTFELYRSDRFRDDAIAGMCSELAYLMTPASPGSTAIIPAGGNGLIARPAVPAPVVPIHLAKRA